MATQQAPSHTPKPRIPFAASVANRAESPDVDARLINGYLEKQEDGTLHVYRRPGMTQFHNFSTVGLGRGIYNWLGDVYAIFGTQLFKNFLQIGTVGDNGKIYSFSAVLGATPRLFFHNTTNFYNWDNSNLVTLLHASTITTTGTVTAGSAIVTAIPSTAGVLANSGIVGDAGIVDGSYVISVDSDTQVTMNAPASGGFTGVHLIFTTPGITQEPVVPGIAYLDSTAYLLTQSAKIFGSNINDTSTPTGWESINFLTAQIEPDKGVAIAKQLVYVIAFKEWSTEFFYDAGNPIGSPLHSVQGNKSNQGCRAAGTVASLEGALLWVSTTREGNVDVQFIDAAKAVSIGTPSIEKLIQTATFTGCYSFGFHISGHKFYILTLPAANLTLVFDLMAREWYRWTDVNGNYLPFVSATIGANQQVMLQHESEGEIYQVSSTVFTDDGEIIPWDLYTPNFDGGAKTNKILSRMDFVADQTPGTILKVRHSETDYKKWSSFREVDLGKKRPNLRDCGSFRRRAWHFSNRTATFLRIQFVELTLAVGTN